MRHIFNKSIFVGFFTCILLSGLFMTACDDSSDVSTTPELKVFGPSPALRGGELKFIGSNLDKVTAIVLQNNVEITSFVSKTSSELIITIPQDSKPGVVILKTSSGDITTKTPLTFTEPISISTYTTAAVKAGDLFTIEGDYLNNIAQVIFFEGASVDSADFVSQTRKKIEVYVPKAAKTGKFSVSNGAEIPVLVYSTDPITVTDPTTLGIISPDVVKPGQDVTLAGTYLNLVETVVLPDGNKISHTDFTLNESNTQITVKTPVTVKEGAIKVITYSGKEISTDGTLQLVAPAITAVAPLLIKNGDELTITGTDLDLVTSVDFATSSSGTVVTGTIAEQSETSIKVTVPMTAYDGPVVVNTNSGLTATSDAISLIKPEITGLSPLSLTAGETVTITGTNLDLIRKISFTGGSVELTPAAGATSLDVVVPMTCAGTDYVAFTTVNGATVNSTDQLAIKAATTPAIATITTSVPHGGLMTITGKNLNYVEAIYFEDNVKAVLYGARTTTSIEVYIPTTAKHGKTTFKMVSFDGEEVTSPQFAYGTDPILSSTIMITNFDGGGNSQSTWGGSFTFGTPAVDLNGTAAMIGKSGVSTSWDWLWAANWGAIPSLANAGDYVLKMDICITKPVTGITAGMCLKGWDVAVNLGDIFSSSTNGQWVTLTFDVLNSTMVIDGTKDWGMYISGASATYDFSGIMIDNLRFDLKNSSASGAPKLFGF